MRFYPKGMVGTETAILWIAKQKFPTRWSCDVMSLDERCVWESWNKTISAGWLELKLRDLSKTDGINSAIYMRWCDISEALQELRKMLCAGEVIAYYDDENGKRGYFLATPWAGNAAQDALMDGIAYHADDEGTGQWCRLVLIEQSGLERAYCGTKTLSEHPRNSSKRGRRPEFDWASIRAYAMNMLDYHGLPSADDPAWNNQARLEERIAEFCLEKFRREPAKSTLRPHLQTWLTDFAAGRKEQ